MRSQSAFSRFAWRRLADISSPEISATKVSLTHAWWVTVPGINFEVGDRISQMTENGKAIALVKISQIFDQVEHLCMK